MTGKLGHGEAFRNADDEIERFRSANARVKKAEQAREAEQRAQDARLQAELKAATMARHPEWFA